MKTLATKATAAIGALFFMSGAAMAQDGITAKVPLRQKWTVGKTYSQTTTTNQTTEMNVGGQQQVTKVESIQESTLSVAKDKGGTGKVVTIKYDRTKSKVSAGGNVMVDFDSAKPGDANPAAAGFKAMVGAELKITLDSDDAVKKVEGMDQILKNAGAGAATLKQMFGEDQIKSMMKQAGLMAPSGKAVGPGDSWPVKHEQSMGPLGKMIVEGKYSFKKMESLDGKQCAVLDFTGTMGMNPKAKPDPNNPLAGMGMKIKDGKLSGTTHFDPKEGIARQAIVNTEMVMEMNNPAAPDGKLVIPIKQKTTVTTKEK